jgi:hypothetical protein
VILRSYGYRQIFGSVTYKALVIANDLVELGMPHKSIRFLIIFADRLENNQLISLEQRINLDGDQ